MIDTLSFIIDSATFVSSHIHKHVHSMRFIAVLDDCNDSKEAGNDQMQEEGEGERIRRRREEEREKGRALLASAVHVARALYMNVTQDVAVGLSCILCTTPPDYTEYHARLRSIIQNTMHAFARLY